jgi:hypothetical protein
VQNGIGVIGVLFGMGFPHEDMGLEVRSGPKGNDGTARISSAILLHQSLICECTRPQLHTRYLFLQSISPDGSPR